MADRTTDRLLHALKAAGPQTAGTLAGRLGVTAVAVRQHLDGLAAQGLVAHEDRREGVGRPRRYWGLAAAGHARFPDNHAGLTVELLEAVSNVFGAAGIERLIAHREAATLASYRRRLAAVSTVAGKVRTLARLRTEEGYMAEWRRDADGSFMLIENHCPICVAARACQGLCRSELGIFAAVLGAVATVTRVEHVLAGARRCAYRIEPVAMGFDRRTRDGSRRSARPPARA
ncbi:metalloregulator ArsR/SmtB family transcription factor [Vineibacter terrae]|uniref:helix-turn-helix transcriptional regulator n=1 Tax=Vineibacter terrae TaxID=2586908 RepID=UPI002E37C953|nr:metalloregulator ArsR/SmtB family transcription factor [Vineibacter terrae]HEX2889600.1 metalloregulator ArsR/SmtB family transcription factor [Vineibacter terrae]